MNKTNYNESTIKFFFPQRENPPSSNIIQRFTWLPYTQYRFSDEYKRDLSQFDRNSEFFSDCSSKRYKIYVLKNTSNILKIYLNSHITYEFEKDKNCNSKYS